ncbi:hypothetical protein BKA93DRAFT_809173 [Sparassis latifolia]
MAYGSGGTPGALSTRPYQLLSHRTNADETSAMRVPPVAMHVQTGLFRHPRIRHELQRTLGVPLQPELPELLLGDVRIAGGTWLQLRLLRFGQCRSKGVRRSAGALGWRWRCAYTLCTPPRMPCPPRSCPLKGYLPVHSTSLVDRVLKEGRVSGNASESAIRSEVGLTSSPTSLYVDA